MIGFLNKIMNNILNGTSNKYTVHKILKTDIFADPESGHDSVYFGCGCFWGAEKCFWKLPGVITTSVGYAGGSFKNPTYNDVCGGYTGHTEVVKVVWDKERIHLSDLLKMFWECHDPTQGNRQGNDMGTQYRSAIYYSNKDEAKELLIHNSRTAYQNSLNAANYGQITTEIKKIDEYYFAEAYHQQYLAIEGNRQYCSATPTKILLNDFEDCEYKLNESIWSNFDWSINKCVLRSDNQPIN
tara:strand:- start:204 stop:926 length:723 start_codon:yes stop_codon:yes gene_type:complete